jgi:rRNA maturation protein Nop10
MREEESRESPETKYDEQRREVRRERAELADDLQDD